MLDYRRRKREQGLRVVQLWAFDRDQPKFQQRLRREAEMVRGHASKVEANLFLGELLEQRLAEEVAEEG